jgi:ribulose-5-phosphate 4-epimerase/fuculose-1-phosphate aldolase
VAVTSVPTTVGVIGLGRMGLPIARNLLDRGFTVVGYRRSASDELTTAGGANLQSAAAVAAESDVLISIVPDADAVDEVVTATTTALRQRTIHIEMSTIPVDRKLRASDKVRAAGGDLLDCPISGSPAMVAPRLATTFADALLLRGNGALTCGRTPGEAAARMWLLAAACTAWLTATASGQPRPLDGAELDYWRGVQAELLPRLWRHLRG